MKIISEIHKTIPGVITISLYRNGDITLKKISISNFMGLVIFPHELIEILQKLKDWVN
jgi:hypothetical protein